MARLGELLVDAGLVEEPLMRRALRLQRRSGGPLGRLLVEQGWVTEAALLRALSAQLQLQSVDLDLAELVPEALAVLPAHYLRKHNILPLSLEPRLLRIAVADPPNAVLADELRVRLGRDVHFVLAGPGALARAFGRAFPDHGSPGA